MVNNKTITYDPDELLDDEPDDEEEEDEEDDDDEDECDREPDEELELDDELDVSFRSFGRVDDFVWDRRIFLSRDERWRSWSSFRLRSLS